MDKDKLAAAIETKSLADYLVKRPMLHHHAMGGRIETTRKDEHKGHQITIRTTYEIEVDGQIREIPLGIDNDGQLHCHALPNYEFNSAIGMVKFLIDVFPGDFSGNPESPHDPGEHGGHGGHHVPDEEGGR